MVAVTPHVNDVLLGRGAAINLHPGNQHLRSLVDSQKANFLNATSKKQKRAIATLVFNEIQSLQPPGRFLVEDQSLSASELTNGSESPSSSNVHHTILKKIWVCVEPDKALAKIMHRMREKDKEEKGNAMQPIGGVWEFPCQNFPIPSAAPRAITIGDDYNVEVGNSQDYQLNDCSASPHSFLEGNDLDEIQNQRALQTSPCVDNFPLPYQRNHSESLFGHIFTEQQSSESVRGGTAIETNSESFSTTDLSNELKGSDLDFDAYFQFHDSIPQLELDSIPQLELDSSQQLRECTCRQWIMNTKLEIGEYIKSALLIALKLTECIVEAEKDERNGNGNPIPLESIATENLMIRLNTSQHAIGKSVEVQEIIEFVWLDIVGNDAVTGTVMSRLFATGKVLYELFSKNMFGDNSSTSRMVSMNFINLRSETESDTRSHKKSHWRSDDKNSNFIAKLESIEIPWSLCALIGNLLECRHDPMCEDNAYVSFNDLHMDLQLMLDNPSCFLDNIQINNVRKLVVPDKLYGRNAEMLKLDELYNRHITEQNLCGTIISGGGGTGKSKLSMHVQKLTKQSNGFFLLAKFEQNQMSLKPLSIIANMLDSLCEMLFNYSPPSLSTEIESELISSLGSHSNLIEIIPNLRKLLPSSARTDSSPTNCVDSAVRMRYLCGELLRIISSHLKPITIVIDDIQFADEASLLLVGSLLFSALGAPIFFALCHREDEASMSGPFKTWLTSISMFSFEPIKLESITTEAVNNLISESLHLSPRITRPLSSILHRKTRGNLLFLRHLLDSLIEQGYIFIDLSRHVWAWDLDKIMELEISHDVLALLMNDIQRLPRDLQFGLQVAACIGSCVTESMLNYLSTDLGLDLISIFQQVSERGFMIDLAGSTKFRFAHDKIQEAVYEMMTELQRRENHMRFGLALCTQSFDNAIEDDELFFAAVNQINQGGPTAVHEPTRMNVFAELNLKAGRRSIELSDYNTAFMLFQHGITFLVDGHWQSSYQVSLDLYDAVVEVALVVNKLPTVTFYSNEVVSNATCFDDKLCCLSTAAKALGVAYHHKQSVDASVAILLQFGEDLPRVMGDDKLRSDMDRMNSILQSTSDDMICNMQLNNDKKTTNLINLYTHLAHVAHYFQPWLVGSTSLRMVAITIKNGLSPKSPLAFAHFGGVLSSIGYENEGCRLGKLALKLVEKKGSVQYKSSVICFVYNTILWASHPLQSIVESHLLGHKAGQLAGDIVFALHNLILAILTDYVAGQNLATVRGNVMDFFSVLRRHGLKIFFKNPVLLLSQISVLSNGPNAAHVDNLPSEEEILADATSGPSISAYGKLHYLSRAFLFRQIFDASLHVDISGAVAESYHQLNPHFLHGYFFEGLTSFLLARQTSSNESSTWIKRGQSVLTKMRCWSEHSQWNWENKVLLLEAESMFTKREFDRAGPLYDSAILSARDHKFIHEEAIASELAGMFYCERGLRQKSYSCLFHSVNCYEKWGADAVVRRVKNVIRSVFSQDIDQLVSNVDKTLEYLFKSSRECEKKRPVRVLNTDQRC